MELNKLDFKYDNQLSINYYKDIIKKVSSYDSNIKVNIHLEGVLNQAP